MKLRLSCTSMGRRKCGRIASPASLAVRCANSRYSPRSARGIEHLALAVGGEHVPPCAGVVACREPPRGVADRVLQRPRTQARARGLGAVDLHEARLVAERERYPQRQARPRIDLLLDQYVLVDPAGLRRLR